MPDTPNTPNYSWPPMDKRRVMGKPTKRLDGPMKSSGRAKYASDYKQEVCCTARCSPRRTRMRVSPASTRAKRRNFRA